MALSLPGRGSAPPWLSGTYGLVICGAHPDPERVAGMVLRKGQPVPDDEAVARLGGDWDRRREPLRPGVGASQPGDVVERQGRRARDRFVEGAVRPGEPGHQGEADVTARRMVFHEEGVGGAEVLALGGPRVDRAAQPRRGDVRAGTAPDQRDALDLARDRVQRR